MVMVGREGGKKLETHQIRPKDGMINVATSVKLYGTLQADFGGSVSSTNSLIQGRIGRQLCITRAVASSAYLGEFFLRRVEVVYIGLGREQIRVRVTDKRCCENIKKNSLAGCSRLTAWCLEWWISMISGEMAGAKSP